MPSSNAHLKIRESGLIKEIRRDIARVSGLENCIHGELLDINPQSKGLVMGFVEGQASVLLLGAYESVNIGDPAYSCLEPFSVPVGKEFFGRIVNVLGEPIDGQGPVKADAGYPIFREAPSVLRRTPITEPFETGIPMIDAMIPVGKGQRELIIGDRMTGKTSICIDAILNQKGKNVFCIYCCIGRSYSNVERVVETLRAHQALDYTLIVSATASCSSGEQYLAPYTACAMGEYLMDRGHDVFIIFDDLTKHAWIYRQISLLLERPPGREAYPGDIFYLHSQFIERAGKYNKENGGGSMTFFPIVETLQGDVTGYISSNLVSMTDGQIYLNTSLFNEGLKPAIDPSLSVSRIGSKAQTPQMRELSALLRLEFVQYQELLKVTKFKGGAGEDIAARLRHGDAMRHLFLQNRNEPYSRAKQLILLCALDQKVLDLLEREQLEHFKRHIETWVQTRDPGLYTLLQQGNLLGEAKKRLNSAMVSFFKDAQNQNTTDAEDHAGETKA